MNQYDSAFADKLAERINLTLSGGAGQDAPGLYYQISRGGMSLDEYKFQAGRIRALESVLQEMDAINKQLNGGDDERKPRDTHIN